MPAPLDRPIRVLLGEGLADLRGLLEANRLQLERELGAPLSLDGQGDATWELRIGASTARLVLDRNAARLVTEAPDRAGLFETLSLLRSLRRLGDGELRVMDCTTAAEACDVVASAVAESWPGFELRAIDWPATCRRFRSRVLASSDPIGELQAWMAELGDAHSTIRAQAPRGRLPYEVEAVAGSLVFRTVPRGSAGERAGAEAGQRLEGIDVDELLRRTAATPHSRSRVAGRRAMEGPLGEAADIRVEGGVAWTEQYSLAPWPAVVESSVLPSGAGYVRIRLFLTEHEPALDAALAALRGRDLVIDLRGNGGGDFLMACRLRDRFVREAGAAGSIRYSHPDGGLTPVEPIQVQPSSVPWESDVTFLVDSLTYSASEDVLVSLVGLPHVRVLGERTGGGSGRVRSLRLLPGWRLTVSTCLTSTRAGRCVEGEGIEVDGPCPGEFAE